MSDQKTTTVQPVTQGRIVLVRLPDSYEERPRLRPAICTRVHQFTKEQIANGAIPGTVADFSVFLAPGDTDVAHAPIFMARGFKFGTPIPTGQLDSAGKEIKEIPTKTWCWPPRA